METAAMSIPKKIYILVLNWNNWKDTIECLESVFQSRYPNFQVICIDNASTDGSAQMIKEWAEGRRVLNSSFFTFDAANKPIPVVTYDKKTAEEGGDAGQEDSPVSPVQRYPLIFIHAGANLGYAGGNNIAIRYVLKKGDGAYLWILNNDAVVNKDALSAMVETIEKNAGVGMAGSKLLYYDRPHILQAAGGCKLSPLMGNTELIANNQEDSGRWNEPLEPDYICGASVLVKKEVIETIGLMDESYFLYWEDADWGVRARRKNFKLLYCPKSSVWHKEGGTSGSVNPLTDYYWSRNGLFFMKKFYPALLSITPFSYLVKYTIVRLIRKQPLNFSAFIRGSLDFIKGRRGKLARPPQ